MRKEVACGPKSERRLQVDQIKIGKFIAECRKNKELTQMQLAEKLNITDKAISKWERGLSLPDSSIMLELCDILGITVNDLLSGEVITMENYNKELEKNLLEVIKEKQDADKRLLSLEFFIGPTVSVIFIALIFIASFVEMEDWLRIVLIVMGVVPFVMGIGYAIKIEQTAGYYECAECGHKYVPSYKSVFMSAHWGRTRRMRCPKCNKKTWQKKVLTKD